MLLKFSTSTKGNCRFWPTCLLYTSWTEVTFQLSSYYESVFTDNCFLLYFTNSVMCIVCQVSAATPAAWTTNASERLQTRMDHICSQTWLTCLAWWQLVSSLLPLSIATLSARRHTKPYVDHGRGSSSSRKVVWWLLA